VKGRDWYGFVWYVARGTLVNLTHLKARLVQSRAWKARAKFTESGLKALLGAKTNETDFEKAKQDILVFIDGSAHVEVWSAVFF
jgi:hypothetical protein